MDYRKKFSEHLHKLRTGKGLSLAQLGDFLGVTDEAVRLLEKSKRSPSFEVLCALSKYFDVSIDYLVGISDDDTPMSFHSEWEEKFRQRLAELLPTFDTLDLRDAYIDVDFLESVAYEDFPLSFHRACVIADELGVSLDYLVGRSDEPN